jgi:small subunit ribosomal protein S20
MANHKSAKKRIRQTLKKRIHNRFHKKTTRSAIKRLRSLEEKTEASAFLPKVTSMIDRLAKKGQFHKNKASNLKSKLTKIVNAL